VTKFLIISGKWQTSRRPSGCSTSVGLQPGKPRWRRLSNWQTNWSAWENLLTAARRLV